VCCYSGQFSFAGLVMLTLTLLGQSPLKPIVIELYNYAETYVRPAPKGKILVPGCTKKPEIGSIRPSILCDNPVIVATPIPAVLDSAYHYIKNLYFVLVFVSATGLIPFRPGNRFLA
jgi:hypothetical protein